MSNKLGLKTGLGREEAGIRLAWKVYQFVFCALFPHFHILSIMLHIARNPFLLT